MDNASTSSATGFLPGGLAWYRKHFTLPKSLAGQRISIEFDGVYRNSDVYLNGKLLGNHPYAYTGFSYDLTGLVHTDGVTEDVIAVSCADQQPSSRWYSGDGIFRNVYLVTTGPVHVARHGMFVTTPGLPGTLSSGYATVQVATDVTNEGSAAASVQVAVTLTSPAGKTAAQGSTTVSVPAGATQTATVSLKVTNPALWSTSQPHLYSARTDLSVGGAAADSVSTPFGIRYTAFDPAAGFSLNGQSLKIQGVNLHATEGAVGSAVRYDALARQMQLMKSMGVNALRTAHNPPAPELIAVCEQLGIVMMVEAFDCWHTGKLPYDYHLYFDQWGDTDIKEMVNAAKNSPAVVLWSIGNETPDTGSSRGPGIAKQLVADVKSIDTSRPVVMGSDQYRSVPATGSPQDLIVGELDGLGVNYNTAMSMDGLHAKYPGKFFFCSEMGSETSTRGVYQDPQLLNTGENYTPGKRATSSYDNNLASWTMSGEYELKKDRDRKFWNGGFLWSGQDYIGEPTPYNVFPVKASFFGAMDTAGFAKDAYYLFRSQWTSEPMVHIVPMDWTSYTPGQPVSVWVYANVPTVELLRNGTSLGVKSFDEKVTTYGRKYLETTEPTHDDYNYPSGSYTSPNGSMGKLHLTWTVPFEPGTLTAVARAGGRVVAQDELRTAGPPHALTLTPDRRVIAADGTSLAFLAVEVVEPGGRGGAGSQQPDPVRAGRPRGAGRGGQRPAGEPAELPADLGARVQRPGAGDHPLVREPGRDHGHRGLRRAGGGQGRAQRGARFGPGGRQRPRHRGPPRGSRRAGRPAGQCGLRRGLGGGWQRGCGRRQLLGLAGHGARGHARRRPWHRLVELLRQGGHRQPARGQRVQPGRLGVGRLAVPAVLRLRPGLVHDQRHAGPARVDRGLVLERREVRAGAEPEDQPGHRVGPADHAQLRPGPQQPGPAGHDQRGTWHGRGIPADRDVGGAERQHRHHLSRRSGE